jgi:hypothetical protein
MSWFSRCYHVGEAGWFQFQTPDGKPVMDQDGFFWSAMEIICRQMNATLALERAKLTQK